STRSTGQLLVSRTHEDVGPIKAKRARPHCQHDKNPGLQFDDGNHENCHESGELEIARHDFPWHRVTEFPRARAAPAAVGFPTAKRPADLPLRRCNSFWHDGIDEYTAG